MCWNSSIPISLTGRFYARLDEFVWGSGKFCSEPD
jgi:hypothetical protein